MPKAESKLSSYKRRYDYPDSDLGGKFDDNTQTYGGWKEAFEQGEGAPWER